MSWGLARAGADFGFVLLVLGLCSCARLPEIAGGECGNGVVEPPEDCDSFDAENAQCRPRGAVGECHLDCNRAAESGRAQCPSGWGCDLSGICRRPTGEFEALPELELGSVGSLGAGDFDGDGHSDLASFEAASPLGATRLAFHYFDAQGLLSETRTFPKTVVAPVISDLSGDRQSDVVFSDQRVGVLLGRTDRSWVPETFSSYRVDDTSMLTLSVFDGSVQDAGGFIVFATFNGMSGLYVTDAANNGLPRLISALGGSNEDLAGNPVSGRVLEATAQSPCLQMVLALAEDSSFSLLDACARDTATGAVTWREQAQAWSIELTPPALITQAPQLVDANGDGHLDVLVGTDAGVYVSHGDGQHLSPGVPYRLSVGLAGTALEIPMPLASADITGDGAPDFVFDDHLLLSSPSVDPTLFDYAAWNRQPPGYWSAAVIADLNGNGKLDVIAASSKRSGVDFFNGTAMPALAPFRLANSRPVQHLAVGDFDGDLIEDLAFTETGPLEAGPSSILMAFGGTAGPPLPPVPVARSSNIKQLNVYREDGLSHLILTSNEDTDERQRGALALLVGSGDRIPTALYDLTSFAADGSTDGSAAIRLATGDFTAPSTGDVVAVAYHRELTNDLEFWLLPALLTSVGAPVHLEGALPPELHPVLGTLGETSLRLASAAADFDGDGRAELVLASPAEDDEHCALAIMSVDSAQVATRASLRIDRPCTAAQLLPVDADLDERVDVVLLSARNDATGGQLSVFWNDGQGGFSSERRLDVSDAARSPSAFSMLAPTPTRSLSFVYATSDALELVSISDATRQLGVLSTLLAVQGCTGLVAADVNGDGADDLAFAKQGNLSVLKASLESL